MPDLFAWALARETPRCGTCDRLGAAIPSGVRYCTRWAVWRWPTDEPACTTWRAA